jgi:hypothetical protein
MVSRAAAGRKRRAVGVGGEREKEVEKKTPAGPTKGPAVVALSPNQHDIA